MVGKSAARIQFPSTLQKLRLHDVFHFSALKPYESAFYNESTAESHERQASDLNHVLEVKSILDFKRAHASSQAPLDKGPHYLVHWRGYSPQHDMRLPVRALSNLRAKVADYLVKNATTRQRGRPALLACGLWTDFTSKEGASHRPRVNVMQPRRRGAVSDVPCSTETIRNPHRSNV